MAKPNALKIANTRIDEEYILTQFNYHYDSERYREHKDRMEEADRLYRGDLSGLFPKEDNLPDIPYVENKFKNALHDIKRLSREGRGAVKFVPEGDKDKDMRYARIRESINEGYWQFNKMYRKEGLMYLDLVGAGFMAASVYYSDASPYPQVHRLNPRFGYPDVADNTLLTYLNVEVVKERVLARKFPHLTGLDASPDNDSELYFACHYDENEVVEAIIHRQENGIGDGATITKRWEHGLGCVPVAFEMLDTFEGAFHGLFEQLKGPLMVRNKIAKLLVDYLESLAHAPLVAEGVINADDTPGPEVVYQKDPNAERSSLERLQPAQAGQGMFALYQMMQDQEEKESVQPPSRSGNVSQSIASGSFVDRTQGQLSSVVKDAEEKMGWLREQVNECAMKTDEQWADFEKPLWRPVADTRMYLPSKHIKGWYFHEVKFGAGAGLDRINQDQRVQAHLAARLISRETAQEQIDYLSDMSNEMDRITRENLADVIFQRMAQDPATPVSALGAVWLEMKQKGASFEGALELHLPQIIAAEQAAQQQGTLPGTSGEVPEEAGPEGGPTTAEQQLAAQQASAPDLAAITQRPPLSLIQVRP